MMNMVFFQNKLVLLFLKDVCFRYESHFFKLSKQPSNNRKKRKNKFLTTENLFMKQKN